MGAGRRAAAGRASRRARARSALVVGTLAVVVATTVALGAPTVAPAGADPVTAQTWASISAGSGFSCAVTTAGAAFCWGRDDDGQLGNGPGLTGDRPAPTAVTLPPGVDGWSSIDAGAGHACAVTTAGDGYCWGDDADGQLGRGTSSASSDAPVPVAAPDLTAWASITAGTAHSCGVTVEGLGYCWGSDGSGRLGDGSAVTGSRSSPSPVDLDTSHWLSIDAGDDHTCGVLKLQGGAFCWGAAAGGALGNGDTGADQASPSSIAAPAGSGWTTITAGAEHSCGATADGIAYCWGTEGEEGRLGNGPGLTGLQPSPTPVAAPEDVDWVTLAAAETHTCATTTVGDAYCWGSDGDGEIGDDDPTAPRDAPSPVVSTSRGPWTGVTVGADHTCAVASSGLGWCWGRDADGESGTGSSFAGFDLPARVGVDQWVDFGELPDRTLDDPPFTVSATAASGLPVTFSASGPCTVDGDVVTVTGAGLCLIAAEQAGDALWRPGGAPRSFTIEGPDGPLAADAGDDQLVNLGDTVTLDGTGSTGTITSSTWTQVAGPAVTVTGTDSPTATFIAPEGPAVLLFDLVVRDGTDLSGDTVTVVVNGRPTASAGPDRATTGGATVTLDGGGSSDPDSDALSHQWTQTYGPAVTLSSTKASAPTFVAPAGPSELRFRLIVRDGRGRLDTDFVTVAVEGTPRADAGADRAVAPGEAVSLTGAGWAGGRGFKYRWAQTYGPTVALTGARTATVGFTAPAHPTELRFRLIVTDSAGRSATDFVTVVVGGPPAADAGPDRAVRAGDVVTLGGSGTTPGARYQWTQTYGTPVALVGANTATPTFTAPAVTAPRELRFRLIVRDRRDQQDADFVTVTVS